MRRLARTILASFLFLTVCSLVGYLAYYTKITHFWTMFGIATGVLAVGIGIGCVKHISCKVVAFFINAVAMGFYLQSWYISRGFTDNGIWLMLGVAALAVAYTVLFVLPLFIPAVSRHYGIYVTVFVLLSLGGYIALVVCTTTTWVSTLGYYGILQLSFILGCSFSCGDLEDEIRALWISSYSIVICAAIILLAVLGGDGCDGCGDGCSCDGGGSISSPLGNKTPKQQKDGLVPPLPPTDIDG
ncbi:MAG: hypothetical protein NC132_03740 [Corallococcus sp.]|nr:hypothetical protein [Corallococcus sp.]MCM1359612.1 hypothetical protein [Corallococcus sp.]MCM1395204.1 hypothetical protein [Corallococcus sp.]